MRAGHASRVTRGKPARVFGRGERLSRIKKQVVVRDAAGRARLLPRRQVLQAARREARRRANAAAWLFPAAQ